jgi:transposase
MNRDRDSGFVGRLDVVATGRRRRWSDAEKLRIVEESLAAPRQALRTARRHDLAPSLLYKWRKAYREGGLGTGGSVSRAGGFVPAVVVAGVGNAPPGPSPFEGRMEVVVSRGRRIIVGVDVDAAALARVLSVLEGLG